jgi:hypothetical protein
MTKPNEINDGTTDGFIASLEARIAELEEMNQGNFILAGEFKDQLLEAMARIERLETLVADVLEYDPVGQVMGGVWNAAARAALKEGG